MSVNFNASRADEPLPELLPITKPERLETSSSQKLIFKRNLLFEGPGTLWLGWQSLLGAGLLLTAGVLLLLGSLWEPEPLLNKAMVVIGGAAMGSALLMLPIMILSLRSLRYKISEDLIEREQGILFKQVDSLDLMRVQDVTLQQSLLQRLLGVGTFAIYSSDRTDPVLLMEGLPEPRRLYAALREAVFEKQRQRRLLTVDQ